ncbi:MAG TPA: hypothetical protein VII39_15365 [Bradyrhizobium sp.]
MQGFSFVGAVAVLALAIPAAQGAGFGFTVDVSLSPKAAATLKARGEGIVVSAMYSGEPIPSKMSKADEMGMIDLGNEDVTIAGANGRAVITGSKVATAHVGWVKAVGVLINVYTARKTTQDNLIDCGIFEDTVTKAQATQPIVIACKIIGEK